MPTRSGAAGRAGSGRLSASVLLAGITASLLELAGSGPHPALTGPSLAGVALGAGVLLGSLGGLGSPHTQGERGGESHPDEEQVAVVFNPSKYPDPLLGEEEIRASLTHAGMGEVRWYETDADDGGLAAAQQAIADGASLVIACGGDGTVRQCVRACSETPTALAILPVGTGNLLATHLGIPTRTEDAIAVITNGWQRRIDVGASDEERFVVMAGMGFDARMVGEAPEPVKSRIGSGAYVISALRNLRGHSPRFTIQVDDAPPRRMRARAVLIGNIGELIAGLALLPDAEIDDGILDIAVLAPANLWHWIGLAGHVITRRRGNSRSLEVIRGRSVEITCERDEPVEFDGDAQPPRSSLRAHVLPQALTLRVPAGCPNAEPVPARGDADTGELTPAEMERIERRRPAGHPHGRSWDRRAPKGSAPET